MSQLQSTSEAAKRWGVSNRRVQIYCNEGRVFGAKKVANAWMIPASAPKPSDARATRYKGHPTLPKSFNLTSIDLFSGPGGLATGFRWAGIKSLIAVEWSYWTARTYAVAHNAEILDLQQYLEDSDTIIPFLEKTERPVLIYGDINKVSKELILELLKNRYELNSVDIVTGGAPCESFSMAGDRKEKDDRNQLYKNVLRISKAVNAKMFMFENVKGLFSKKHSGEAGAMYKAICEEFESESSNKNEPSYRLVSREKSTVLLKATDYGVPQSRERLFLVGLNNRFKDLSFSYPIPTNSIDGDLPYITVENAISDLPKISVGRTCSKYSYSDKREISSETPQGSFLSRMRGELSMPPDHLNFEEDTLNNHKAPGHTERMLERMKLIRQGENMKTACIRLSKNGKEDLVEKYFPKKIYAARNRRLKSDEPSFTVTSHCLDEMIHPTANRGLSPREVARLQSFPDWYDFQGPYVKFHSDPEQDMYEQIGDAIPPLLAYALGEEFAKSLNYLYSTYN